MTRNEIISSLRGLIGKYNLTDEEWQTVEKTIKILNNSDEDCISRKAVLNTLDSMDKALTEDRTVEEYKAVLEECYKVLPSIQPKPMQVELEGDGYSDGELVYDYGKCPKCGWEFEYGDKDWEEPYCCHCGQRLKWFESEDEG